MSKKFISNKQYTTNLAAEIFIKGVLILLVTFRVSRRRREMYCCHARLCVCLSVCCVSVCLPVRSRMPTLLHGPGCDLAEW